MIENQAPDIMYILIQNVNEKTVGVKIGPMLVFNNGESNVKENRRKLSSIKTRKINQ